MSFDDDIIDEIRKYKNYIIIGIIFLLIILLMVIVLMTRKDNGEVVDNVLYYIDLMGENAINIYVGEEYVEPGYKGYDEGGKNLTDKVIVTGSVNTDIIGTYNITYILGNITKERTIKVIKKEPGSTYIHLYGDVNTLLYVGEEYVEKNCEVVDTVDGNKLRDKVKIVSNVNTDKAGIYKVTYSVTNSSDITTMAVRTVIVMDSSMSISLGNSNYTSDNVKINIYVNDDLFEYLLLPNGNRVSDKIYTYEVSENGTYKFVMHNSSNKEIEKMITVNNIDKIIPTGSCSGSYGSGISVINVKASDDVGIAYYEVNGTRYTSSSITVNQELSTANVVIYDKSGNKRNISCNLVKNAPSISCTGTYYSSRTEIVITDNDYYNRYVVEGNEYKNNRITINKKMTSVNVNAYGSNNDSYTMSCDLKKGVENTSSSGGTTGGYTDQNDGSTCGLSSNKSMFTGKIASVAPSDIGCTVLYKINEGIYIEKFKFDSGIMNNFKDVMTQVCRYASTNKYIGTLQSGGSYVNKGGCHGQGKAIDLNNQWSITVNGKKYTPYSSNGYSTWNKYKTFICEVCNGREDCEQNINYQIYYKYFKPAGWCWGGNWTEQYFDPMHFEYTGDACGVTNSRRITCN